MQRPFLLILAASSVLVACQSTQQRPVPAAVSGISEAALPSALPAGSVHLTGDEIEAAFSGVREEYWAIDDNGVTAVGIWNPDGTMTATWTNGRATGNLAGTWYVDGSQRCIQFTSGVQSGMRNPECSPMYVYGEGYLSVNPDGSLHGYHDNSPL